jgi:hypothetical protein
MSNEYIICAAIHFDDGKQYLHQPKNIKTGYVICGRRHHNCYLTNSLIHKGSLDWKKEFIHIQGFLTNADRFVDRKEAYEIAFKVNQISDKVFDEEGSLISEDLY